MGKIPETDEQGNERVNPEYCRKCGFRGTPLCTHPTGYYQPEPEGLNKLVKDYIQRQTSNERS